MKYKHCKEGDGPLKGMKPSESEVKSKSCGSGRIKGSLELKSQRQGAQHVKGGGQSGER